MSIRILTKHESKQFMRENWAWENNALEAIQQYPDFHFTADGKFFAMALDGESIGHRMNALGCPDFRGQHDCTQLCAVEGVIGLYDNEHDEESGELFVYRDRRELLQAWKELHHISGVEMSEHDQERLGMLDEHDGSDDED